MREDKLQRFKDNPLISVILILSALLSLLMNCMFAAESAILLQRQLTGRLIMHKCIVSLLTFTTS